MRPTELTQAKIVRGRWRTVQAVRRLSKVRKRRGALARFSRFPVFLGGAALGAVIDYLVALVASHMVGLDPPAALGAAMLFSVSVVFLFHECVTFAVRPEGRFHRYVVFLGSSVLIFAVRALVLSLALHHGSPLELALLVAIGLGSIFNYTISSILIFTCRT